MTPALLPLAGALRRGLAAAALGLAAGCSAISAVGDAATPLEVYTLRAPADGPVARGGPAPLDVIVEVPTTSGALDTDRIMIRPSALQAQYLPGARWGDPVPVMVQGLMLRTLEDAGAFRYVGRRPLGPGGDFALVSEVTDFEAAVAAGGGAVVTLRLTARLVREEGAEIVAARTFSATAATATTEGPDLLGGFDRAARQLLGEVAAWTLDALGVAAGAA